MRLYHHISSNFCIYQNINSLIHRTNRSQVLGFTLSSLSMPRVIFGKFHWTTRQPAPALTHEEAAELTGTNPEYKTQDLFDSIAKGNFPSWDLYIQLMTIEQARKYTRNPFDITKVWRVEEFPLIPVGRMTLDRNPSNYFAEVEQAAFSPSISVMKCGLQVAIEKALINANSNKKLRR